MLSELSAIRKIGKIFDIKTGEIVFLTIEETKLLLSQPNLSKEIGIRDRFFMYLLYDSGCCVQEMLDLKLKDFVISKSGVELHVIGKVNKFRAAPISKELITMFEGCCHRYHKDINLDSYLFYTKRNGIISQMSCDNVQNMVKKYGVEAKKLCLPCRTYTLICFVTHERCISIWQVCLWN